MKTPELKEDNINHINKDDDAESEYTYQRTYSKTEEKDK